MASALKSEVRGSPSNLGISSLESKKRSHDEAIITNGQPSDEIAVKRSLEVIAEDTDQAAVPAALLKILNSIDNDADASFAANGSLSNAANPGLFVKELGGIGLPLSEHDAHRLAGICHQAPFGKGSETVVDTSVRKTLELNPSQFELQNPAWQQTLDHAIAKVADGLGLAFGAASVRAELYKLLLYEEGAFFDRHRDSEKAPGMLGTLVMSLPSWHTGGDVQVSFGKENRVFATAPDSRFGFSYLAWYADVEHAVHRVTSGRRLVLTYNLIHKRQGTAPHAESHSKPELEILKLFDLKDKDGYGYLARPMAYMLEHKYTEANLQMENLKGKDRSRAYCLQQACQKHGLSFFLANMVLEVSGGCNEDQYEESHEIDEEGESSLNLKILVHPDGSVRARDLPYKEEYILQPEPFERNPDDEDYSGWTGNEGVSATHWYRDSCVVIFSDEEELDRLSLKSAFSSPGAAKDMLSTLMNELRGAEREPTGGTPNPSLERCRRRLSNFCDEFVTWKHFYHLDRTLLGDLASATIQLDRPRLFQLAAEKGRCRFSASTYQNVGSALAFHLCEPAEWQRGMAIVLKRSETRLSTVWAALCAVRDGYECSLKEGSAARHERTSSDALKTWTFDTAAQCLAALAIMNATDGETLIKIAQESQDCERFLFKTVLPCVKKHITRREFVFAVLRTLYQSNQAGRITEKVTVNLYRDVLGDFGPDLLGFKDSNRPYAVRGFGTDMSGSRNLEGKRINVKPTDLATLCCQSLSLGLNNEVLEVLREIGIKSEEYSPDLFKTLWLPFLRNFFSSVARSSTQIANQYRPIFQVLIDSCVRHYLQKPPPTPIITTPKQLGCRACDACSILDRFLVHPDEEIQTFTYVVQVRKHLLERLGNHYRTKIDKRKSPHRLVVYKKPDKYRAVHAMAEYQKRRAQVTKEIQSIGLSELNKFLGTNGNELIDFDSPKYQRLLAGGSGRMPLANVSEHSSGNRTNRPAPEIVDLTK